MKDMPIFELAKPRFLWTSVMINSNFKSDDGSFVLNRDMFSVNSKIIEEDLQSGTMTIMAEISSPTPDVEESILPYYFCIVAMIKVNFIIPCEVFKEDDNIRNAIAINAMSVLYGAAREYLWTITSHGPLDPMSLPSWRFSPEEIQAIPSVDEDLEPETEQ